MGEIEAQAEPGSAGWLLPADPLINATAHLDAWQHALTLLGARLTATRGDAGTLHSVLKRAALKG